MISLGDPAGIGPEVVLRALTDETLFQNTELTLVGCGASLRATADRLSQQGLPHVDPEQFPLVDIAAEGPLAPGQESAVGGEASFRALEAAIARCLGGEADAVVTAPIAKSAWKAAGHLYPGQTELLAERAGCDRFGMLFVARSPHSTWVLRLLLATTHIPLRRVPEVLSAELMARKLELLATHLEQGGLNRAEIAIPGLNPHSGEQGQLGQEEQDWLIPWLEQERRQRPHLTLTGPVPPDTLWLTPARAWQQPGITAPDAFLALYHDQGLIPVKMLAFDRAVNCTIGLPFVRTSPDHGTAFDIAGKGLARPDSMAAAIREAVIQVTQRRGRG